MRTGLINPIANIADTESGNVHCVCLHYKHEQKSC